MRKELRGEGKSEDESEKEIVGMLTNGEEQKMYAMMKNGTDPRKVDTPEWRQAYDEAKAEAEAVTRPHQETMRMRIERAARGGEAAESYFKSVKRNAPRTNEAADKIDGYTKEIDDLEQKIAQEKDSAKKAELQSQLDSKRSDFNNFVRTDDYGANIYWEQSAKTVEQEVAAARARVLTGVSGTKIGEDLIVLGFPDVSGIGIPTLGSTAKFMGKLTIISIGPKFQRNFEGCFH